MGGRGSCPLRTNQKFTVSPVQKRTLPVPRGILRLHMNEYNRVCSCECRESSVEQYEADYGPNLVEGAAQWAQLR